MILEPAGKKPVSLAELRFKPANSNDAARAVLSHQFANVPRCAFTGDDGISPYLASETLLASFPASPGNDPVLHPDVPAVTNEIPEPSSDLRRKLLRGGFGLSVFLHAFAAFAIGYTTLALPEEDAMLEGITSVSIIVEGNADADEAASGDIEKAEAPEVEPEPTTEVDPDRPVPVAEPKPVVERPEPETTENILKQVPLPELGSDIPEILVARQPAQSKVEAVARPLPAEEKIEPLPLVPEIAEVTPPLEQPKTPVEIAEPATKTAQPLAHPVSKPLVRKKPVEETVERKAEKKPEPVAEQPKRVEKKTERKVAEKPKTKEKVKESKTTKGNQGQRVNNARKGDTDAQQKGHQARENSRGQSLNRESGNAARSNYKGLVQKKLQRAKGRVRNPGKGRVLVSFTITASGAATGVQVVRSSGKTAVDAAAIKIVSSASPFPAIPAEVGRKSLKMSITIDFR